MKVKFLANGNTLLMGFKLHLTDDLHSYGVLRFSGMS